MTASISILKIENKHWIVLTCIGVSALGLGYSIYSGGFNHLANFAFALVSLLVTMIYGLCLYTNEMSINNTFRSPIRLISIALMLYHCGTFAIVCAINFVMSNKAYGYIVDINTTLDSLKYLLIAIAFYQFRKKSATITA